MRKLWAILSLVLATLWLPVSSHPVLEGLGLIHGGGSADPAHSGHGHDGHDGHGSHHDHDHDHDHGDGDHDLADGVCRKEALDLEAPGVPDRTCPAAHLAAMLWHFEALIVGVEGRGDPPPSPVPPDLLPAWHFSLRAALPVRAPSSDS